MNKKLRCLFILLVAICMISTRLSATTFLIKVDSAGSMKFSPNALSVASGDTIIWIWASGIHTTTSDSIPAGAAAWSDSLTSVKQTYTYIPHIQGTYYYFCAFHKSMGMTGYFVVGPPNNVPIIPQEAFTISPNPASERVVIHTQMNKPHISLYDIIGRQVKDYDNLPQNGKEISLNISDVPKGVYLLKISSGDVSNTIKLTIAR